MINVLLKEIQQANNKFKANGDMAKVIRLQNELESELKINTGAKEKKVKI